MTCGLPGCLASLRTAASPSGREGSQASTTASRPRGGGILEQLLDGRADHDGGEAAAAEGGRDAARGELIGRHHCQGSVGRDVAGVRRPAS